MDSYVFQTSAAASSGCCEITAGRPPSRSVFTCWVILKCLINQSVSSTTEGRNWSGCAQGPQVPAVCSSPE